MKTKFFSGLLTLMAFTATHIAYAIPASDSLWTDMAPKVALRSVEKVNVIAGKYRQIQAEIATIENQLYDNSRATYELMLPLPDGSSALFRLQYAPVYQPILGQKYPSIRTFTGYQVGKPSNSGRFDITPQGFHGMFNIHGQEVFIDPLQRGNNRTHISYYKKDAQALNQPTSDRVARYANNFIAETNIAKRAGETQKIYRIAVAATGEYTEFHGGTKELAQAAIVTLINRVNEVYEVDLSVSLVLVSNNDAVVYVDAATDPFDNSTNDIDTNTTVMAENIGDDNFDVGHVVNTAGGGLAGLGVVCSSSKAAGVTGRADPVNDPFAIDYVAHEIGHQFGGEHPYNGQAGACTTASNSDAYEPGSGSTIMAYAGICGEQNLQNNSDAYFHVHSLDQMRAFIDTATCSSNSELNNQSPVASAGADHTIPGATPFKLTGSATDTDGDALSYVWEQFDLGTRSSSRVEMVDDGSRPLFRSWMPTASPVRYLPRLADVIEKTTVIGETYAMTDRTMNFRLTVRDGKGNINNDAMVVTVDKDSGPLVVTAPVAGEAWSAGMTPVVNWDVANTDQEPVNCANVDILLSTDGGLTFTTSIVNGTANDGAEAITVPSLDSSTSAARVQVQCSDNIFFAVSDGDFTVNETASSATAPVITGQSAIAINEDNAVTIALTDLSVTDSNDTYPTGFTLTLSAGSNYSVDGLTITPNADYSGILRIPVQVNDGAEDSGIYSLVVTVVAINDVPVITQTPTLSVNEDNSLNITTANLTISDPDNADADLLVMLSEGDNYSVDGSTITPNANFNGTLVVGITVNDGSADSNTVNASVNVVAVNDAPMLMGLVETLIIEQNSSLLMTLQMLDIVDPDNTIEDLRLNVLSGSNYSTDGSTVTPNADYFGPLSINVNVNDGARDSSTEMLPASVIEKSHPPVIAAAASQTINEDESLSIDFTMLTVTDNDNTIEQLTLAVMAGENYSVAGTSITPSANFGGILMVGVTVSDDEFTTEVHNMTITVTPVNDAPVATNDNVNVAQDSSNNRFSVLDNDTDVEGDSLSITAIVYGGSGTASISGSNIIYTPAKGFDGGETLSYTLADGNGGVASARVNITVTKKASSGGGSVPLGWIVALVPLALLRRLRFKMQRCA
jgi:hypothetical protein